jgi:hypothetical protein
VHTDARPFFGEGDGVGGAAIVAPWQNDVTSSK